MAGVRSERSRGALGMHLERGRDALGALAGVGLAPTEV